MDEEAALEVRAKLERALRRKLYDAVWQHLLDEGLVRDYLNESLEEDPKEAWRVLKEVAEKWLRLVEAVQSEIQDEDQPQSEYQVDSEAPPREGKEDYPALEAILHFLSLIGAKSRPMAQATSSYFEWLVNQHPEVVRFRDEVLGGKTLSLEQAHKLLGSYAARFFPLEWFSDWRIPVVGHTSEIIGGYDWGLHEQEVDHRVTLWVEPPGITKRVRYAHPDTLILDEGGDKISSRCVLMKKRGSVVPPYNIELLKDPEDTKPTSPPPMLSRNYETPNRPMAVWPGSVVDKLYVLAEELADAFRWPSHVGGHTKASRLWSKDTAAKFILTGVAPLATLVPLVPLARPIDARLKLEENKYLGSQRRIELNIAPWVSAEEVTRAYKRMQKQVLEGRNRQPKPKTLEVACFVWEAERRHEYNRPSWRVLCDRWNKEHPKDQFKDYHHFRTYFTRGAEAVKQALL
jgi:hypothetical protein